MRKLLLATTALLALTSAGNSAVIGDPDVHVAVVRANDRNADAQSSGKPRLVTRFRVPSRQDRVERDVDLPTRQSEPSESIQEIDRGARRVKALSANGLPPAPRIPPVLLGPAGLQKAPQGNSSEGDHRAVRNRMTG